MPWSDENSTSLSAWFYIRKDVLREKQDFFQVGPEPLYKDMVWTRIYELFKHKGFHLCAHWLKSFMDFYSLWSELTLTKYKVESEIYNLLWVTPIPEGVEEQGRGGRNSSHTNLSKMLLPPADYKISSGKYQRRSQRLLYMSRLLLR